MFKLEFTSNTLFFIFFISCEVKLSEPLIVGKKKKNKKNMKNY